MGSTAVFCVGAMLGTNGVAQAQDQDQEAIEEVVVTGSRIPRPDVVSNSPVSVIDAEEFELTLATEAEDVLGSFPQITPIATATTNNPGTGTALISLRNLGSVRTLVLVNGRRFIGSDVFGRVDVNNIPPALIERTDIVTGGASAVYGSDAVSGVVNFILKDDFEGMQADAQFGVTQRGDSERYNVSLTMGTNFADGKGNVTIFGNWFKRARTLADARGFSENAWNNSLDSNGNLVQEPGGSTTIPQGRFSSLPFGDVNDGLDPFGTAIGSSGVLIEGSNFRAMVRPQDEYNFAPANNLQLPGERWMMTSTGHYQFTEDFRLFAEMSYANMRIDRLLAATPFGESGFMFDLRNPFMPAAFADYLSNFDTDDDNIVSLSFNRRMLEAGERLSLDNRNTYRFVVGFDGKVADTWDWEVYYNFGRFTNSNRQDGNISISRMQQGLLVDPEDPTQCLNTSNGCVVLNVFGEGVFTQDMVDFVRVAATNLTSAQQQVLAGSLVGDLFELPAGPVGVAFGAEWRSENASFQPDTFLASGDVDGFNAGLPTQGHYSVWEVYSEARVPIVSGEEWADYLGLEAGIRFSDYSLAGSVTSYKILAEYQPISELKIRGGFQRAIRAPNINELFRGIANSFPGGDDFCNAVTSTGDPDPDRTAAERQFCLENGIPMALIDNFVQNNTQIEVLLGGNANLQPEKSDTWTVGGVWQPDSIPGLQLTIDYYNIEIDDAISSFGGGLQSTLTACRLSLDPNDVFCQRLTDARRSDGQLEKVDLSNQNIAFLKSSGIDFRADYDWELPGDWGVLDISMAGTKVFDLLTQGSPVVPIVHCEGFAGVRGTCGRTTPTWKFVNRVTWRHGDTRFSLRHRFLSSVKDERITLANSLGNPVPVLPVPNISSRHYLDATAVWDINETYRVSFTVTNLMDKEPPLLDRAGGVAGQFNTDAAVYDILGRRFVIGLTAKY